jgi:RNA polymerase primary sigma factor
VDERVARLRRAQGRLRGRLGREPSDAELAVHLDLPVGRVARLMEIARTVASLDGPVGDDGVMLGDLLADEGAVDLGELAASAVGQRALAEALRALPERERKVLSFRFGLDSGTARTLQEVGAMMGFSRERARQLERSALAALRDPETRARLEDLVPA